MIIVRLAKDAQSARDKQVQEKSTGELFYIRRKFKEKMITRAVQRWNLRKPKYVPVGEVIQPAHYEIIEISDALAKGFVLNHHYSSAYPAARRRFGLFRGSNLVGVAVFSHPCNERTITNVFGCEKAIDGLELGRFVLLDSVPANGESWFLARCREILKPDYVGVVSFSDDMPRTAEGGEVIFPGHIGTIYQASNAAFLGRGTARTLRLLPDGKVISDRTIQKIRKGERGWQYGVEILRVFGADACPSDDLRRRVWLTYWLGQLTRNLQHHGNLKYAWSFSKKVKLLSLPYPKFI